MRRVLVVDDSQFMRTVVAGALTDAGYEVLEASTGERAIETVESEDLDVITMDVEMPGMGGIEAVEHIMEVNPTPIVMVSAHTERGADATFAALESGAVDFLAKPNRRPISRESIDEEIVSTVEAAAEVDVSALTASPVSTSLAGRDAVKRPIPASGGALETTRTASSPSVPGVEGDRYARQSDRYARGNDRNARKRVSDPIVVIGASTGGPRVIQQLLYELPVALDARVLIVQHMPPGFTGRLATRLDQVSDYDVREATDGATVARGEALVARGGTNMRVSSDASDRVHVRFSEEVSDHDIQPSIDVTMISAAETVNDPLIGVVLTGMGRDGVAGIEAIREADGSTIAQDERTSPLFGIPKRAIETGCIDHVLPAEGIANAIQTVCTE